MPGAALAQACRFPASPVESPLLPLLGCPIGPAAPEGAVRSSQERAAADAGSDGSGRASESRRAAPPGAAGPVGTEDPGRVGDSRAARKPAAPASSPEQGAEKAKAPARVLAQGPSDEIPAATYSPTPKECSTIGSAGLNFRVRDGNGWNPCEIATGNCWARRGLLIAEGRSTRARRGRIG